MESRKKERKKVPRNKAIEDEKVDEEQSANRTEMELNTVVIEANKSEHTENNHQTQECERNHD